MERRKRSRYPLTCDVEALPSKDANAVKQDREQTTAVRGTAVNVSCGGACILGEGSLEQFSICRCLFHFPGVPVPVPLLMQVRWVEPVPAGDRAFRIGLSFIA